MRDTHHLRRLTPLALLATLALAACTGGDPAPSAPENEGATPTTEAPPTVEATPTATTEATPPPEVTATATATATPAPVALIDGIPKGAVGPLLVYTGATRRVVTYDLGAERQIASFEAGTAEFAFLRIRLVGTEIFINLEHRLEVRALNGQLLRTLRDTTGEEGSQPGGPIADFTVSADGRSVALEERIPDDLHRSLVVLDANTGEEITSLTRTDPQIDVTPILVRPDRWRDDGSGLLVVLVTNLEASATHATLSLDGSLQLHDTLGWTTPAPSGRRVAHGLESLGCMAISGHRVLVDDLDTGARLASIEDPTRTFFVWGWSPDSTELLVRSLPFPTDPAAIAACNWWRGEPTWLLLSTDGTPPLEVDGPLEVRQRWDGDRAVTFFCNLADPLGRPVAPPVEVAQLGECVEDPRTTPPQILVNGVTIGEARAPTILGWIELP